MRLLVGLLAIVAILTGSCQSTSVPPTGPTTSSGPTAAATSRPTATPLPSAPVDADQVLYGTAYASTAGVRGGSVVVGLHLSASTLYPYFGADQTDPLSVPEILSATMRSLLRVTSDGHLQPDLAAAPITFDQSVRRDASGSGFTVHVTLRPNLRWSDGQPMTLFDLKYTWMSLAGNAGQGVDTPGWENIDGIDVAADGLSADVHFPTAYPGWLTLLGGNPILPEHYMRTIPFKDWPKASYPLSPDISRAPTIGPFKYVTATADTIVLARNDEWAGPAASCDGVACLDTVTFRIFPNNTQGLIQAFLGGSVDVALHIPPSAYDAIAAVDPSVGRATLVPAWTYEHLDMNEAGLGPGRGHPALRDLTVRTAIEEAIDKRAMWGAVFPGTPDPSDDPCTNATPSTWWRLPDAACPSFDVTAANGALDAAGYTTGADGIRVDPGSKQPLVLQYCAGNDPASERAGAFLVTALQAIGIKVEADYVDLGKVMFAPWSSVAADTKCSLVHGNYDLSEFRYLLTFDLFGDYYYTYESSQIPTAVNGGNGYNWLRFADPVMDAALGALRTTIDPSAQLAAAYRVQQAYVSQVPEIVLWYTQVATGVATRLHGFEANPALATTPGTSDQWNIEDWWVQP